MGHTIEKEDEIDLLELIQKVWQGRKTIFKFLIIFGLIGLFIALFSEKEYTASTTAIPQTSEGNKMGSLGGLAAMAGINIEENSNNGISPKLYPKIAGSIPFKMAVLEAPIQIERNGELKQTTFKEYYQKYYKVSVLSYVKKYTIGLPGVILNVFKSENKENVESKHQNRQDSIYRISSEQNNLFSHIKNQLTLNVNDKEGIVKISFSMPEALASAQMLKFIQDLLQKSITKFKVEKLKSDYHFIEQSYKNARANFLRKQAILANFKDRNQGLVLSRSQSKSDRLQAEYNLAYNLYSELAKQLEGQKIKLKEKTPVFTTIDPISVPTEKSKPRRAIILIIWLFLGGVLGVGVVLGREFISNFKKNDAL